MIICKNRQKNRQNNPKNLTRQKTAQTKKNRQFGGKNRQSGNPAYNKFELKKSLLVPYLKFCSKTKQFQLCVLILYKYRMSSKLVFNVPCPNNTPDPSQAASLTSCVTSYILGLIQPSQTQTFGGFKWNLYTRKFPTGGSYSYPHSDFEFNEKGVSYTNYYWLKVYLECYPENEDLKNWECTAQCQIHLVQSSQEIPSTVRPTRPQPSIILLNQLLPNRALTFSRYIHCQYVDDFYRREQPDLGRCLQTSILFCCDLEKCNLNKCVNEFNVTITDLIVKC
uniref:Uncharacterized protein n=1 Tax=Cacopsylla melanoneura TaxID=428564 RepID=A0A8D8YBZ4_9HEMI